PTTTTLWYTPPSSSFPPPCVPARGVRFPAELRSIDLAATSRRHASLVAPGRTGGHMLSSRLEWLRRFVLLAVIAVFAPFGPPAFAQTRQVSTDSLVYDLGNPDPVRRQDAAQALGAAHFQQATPELVALAHDPIAAVRRAVEMSLERMEDVQAL